MPVKLKIDFVDGWKKDENSRFGKALVLKFINENGGETLFEYAPKCEDKKFFEEFFELLECYDTFLIKQREFEAKQNNKENTIGN